MEFVDLGTPERERTGKLLQEIRSRVPAALPLRANDCMALLILLHF
jgi:hypothetical protein